MIEYMGEVITHKEFVRRTKKYEAEGLSHYYSMTLTNEEVCFESCSSIETGN